MIRKLLLAVFAVLVFSSMQSYSPKKKFTFYCHDFFTQLGVTYAVNITAEPASGNTLTVTNLDIIRTTDCFEMSYCGFSGTLSKFGANFYADLDIDLCGGTTISYDEYFNTGPYNCATP